MNAQHNSLEPVVAIVVAAGSGVRLGGETPKALRLLGGVPLVTRSVRQLASGGCTHAIVVIAEGLQDAFSDALAHVGVPVSFVTGGATRQESARNGLLAMAASPTLAGASIVLVHDAARALVPTEVVARVIAAVRAGAPAVIPVVPVIDSVRELTALGSAVVDRSGLRAVQTPQGFDHATLAAAHQLAHEYRQEMTDDAAVCEYAGHRVTLVDGDREALKITEPLDLVLAEAIVAAR